MPLLNVQLSCSPDSALSSKIATGLTNLTSLHLKKKPELTAVNIAYLGEPHWFVGCETVSSSFSLRICITAGTNTKREMSDYIATVYQFFEDLLGSVKTESYIVIDEIPGENWGYGGRTQKSRQ